LTKHTLSEASSDSLDINPELAPDDAKFTDDIASGGSANEPIEKPDRPGYQEDTLVKGELILKTLLDLDSGEAKRFSIDTGDADIEISAHSSNRIVVTAVCPPLADLATFNVVVKRKALNVSLRDVSIRKRVWRSKSEGVRLIVALPDRFFVQASSSSGSIAVNDVTGKVSTKSLSGNITLNGLSGAVVAQTHSGDIVGECPSSACQIDTKSGNVKIVGLKGSFTCNSKSGDVCLKWIQSPVDAKVLIRAGRAAVNLVFPSDAKPNYRFITSASAIMNEFEQHDSSTFRVRIISKRGNLSLRKADGTRTG